MLERGESLVKEKFIAVDKKYDTDAMALADDLTCITITHLSNYINIVLKDDVQAHRALVIITTKILDLEIEYVEEKTNNGILSIKKK